MEWLILVLLLLFFLLPLREGNVVNTPSDLVQVQIGKIQQLQSQVAELTLTPDGVSALMSAVSDTFTNISVLQANIQPPVSEY
jgi:hypothetical protein